MAEEEWTRVANKIAGGSILAKITISSSAAMRDPEAEEGPCFKPNFENSHDRIDVASVGDSSNEDINTDSD